MTSKKLALEICMHGAPSAIVAIARASMRAGLSKSQSILIARMALHVRQSNEDSAEIIGRGIVQQMRREHAAQWPRGKWATLFARCGARAIYMDPNGDEARSWATPMLDSSYGVPS